MVPIPETLDLRGYSYTDRQGLLPGLVSAFTQCGGWVLERKTTSATTIEFRIEIQLRSIVELYGSLIAAGVELTRNSHALLTDLCTCRHNLPRNQGSATTRNYQPSQILALRLELSFLEDVTLHSLLMTGSSLA
jgi:hypothetical protein